MKKIITLFLLTLFLIPTIQAYAPPETDEGTWKDWISPPTPYGYSGDECFDDLIITTTPDYYETDIQVTAKGVQICANVSPPTGCTVTITFQWLNLTEFYDDWITWAETQEWGTWDDMEIWWDNIDWENQTNWENHSYWYNFTSTYTNINSTTQLCQDNLNVSCRVDNDYTREYFYWRVNYTLNCSGNITQGYCMYPFRTEYCSTIQEIYPPSPTGYTCPCCAENCISVNNTFGHPMNLTFYRSDMMSWIGGTDTYLVNQIWEVPNGTWCFCIDGFMIDNNTYQPMNYYNFYVWNVSVEDTVTGGIVESDMFFFQTYPDPSYCPCGGEALVEYIEENGGCRGEIVSSPGFETLMFMTSLILIGFILYKKKR